MGVNSFEYFGEKLFDISEDTVEEDLLPEGVTAHNRNGDPIVGKKIFVESVNNKTGKEIFLSAEDVGARPSTWTPTAEAVGADKKGTASNAVSEHNTETSSHNDIRLLIQDIANRLNAIANSTDIDLDDFKEVVAYIKANRDLIEQVTTNKINYTDIIDNLTTNVKNKPLSAAQGVAIKKTLDTLLDAPGIEDIFAINTYYYVLPENIAQKPYTGITWEDTTVVLDQDEGFINEVLTYHRVPILFDENTMETEIDNQGILKVKAKGDYQTKEDINLLTDSKEVVGAINELNEALYKNPPSEGLSYFVNGTYAVCSGIGTCTDSQIVIASSYLGFPVTQIAQSAFDADYYPQVKGIKSIIVPDTVERIGNYAFYNCNGLEFAVIPKNVTYIGAYAFYAPSRPKYANVYFEAEAEPSTFDGNWAIWAVCNLVWGADIAQKSKPQLPTASQSVVGAIAEIYHKNDVYNAEYNGSHEYTIHYPNGILKAGMTLTIVPDSENYNDDVYLWWDGLTGQGVRIVRNRYDGNKITGTESLPANWLKEEIPYRVMYDGEYFVLVDYPILEIAGGEGSDNSLLGTWVFNDSVYLGDDVSDNFIYEFDVFGSGGDIEDVYQCNNMYIDGSDLRYMGDRISLTVYNDGDGWRSDEYKTIRIKSEPTDTDFIAWLKDNAKKQGSSGGGSGTYPDETDYFLGYWKFNNNLNLPSQFSNMFPFTVDMYYGSSYVEYTAGYEGITVTLSELLYFDGSDDCCVFDTSGGWYEEDYRTIYIMEEPTSDEMKQWIWENATKQEDYPDDAGS